MAEEMSVYEDWDYWESIEEAPDDLKTIVGYENEWVSINDFPDYEINIYGDVYDKVREKTLTHYYTDRGYKTVELKKNGAPYRKKVHRLVAQAFIPNPENKPEINHIDTCKKNCRVTNLEWNTRSENMLHASKNNLIKGVYNKTSFPKRKIKIVETGEVFDSVTECAKRINGQVSKISNCADGKRNTHCGYHFERVED